ncbi:hypothetical protein Taro_030713, partial [Colocasia esculenta]|nr:hypothetical protein [Colocasia esculenta]
TSPLIASGDKTSFRGLKTFVSHSEIAILADDLPYSKVFGNSDSLDYANRWRSPHAEPPSHSYRKSCSTRREISYPAKELGITFRTGIGIAYVTTIRNRHSETVDKALVSRNFVPGPKSPSE